MPESAGPFPAHFVPTTPEMMLQTLRYTLEKASRLDTPLKLSSPAVVHLTDVISLIRCKRQRPWINKNVCKTWAQTGVWPMQQRVDVPGYVNHSTGSAQGSRFPNMERAILQETQRKL